MENTSTRVVLKNVRLSYEHVWEPKPTTNGDLKYSASLIFPKTDKANLARIKSAVEAAKEAGKSKLANKKGVIPSGIKMPLRDGDERGDDAYDGCYFVNANSSEDHPPKIVDRHVNPIMDRDEVYSGCYANVSVNFFAFNTEGNIGIGCGLGNIQKIKDGERLSGGASADEDFDDMGEGEEVGAADDDAADLLG